MANCGGCSNQRCSCFIIDGGSVTTANGIGSLRRPFYIRNATMPNPVPWGYMYRSTTQSITASTATQVLFNQTGDVSGLGFGNMADTPNSQFVVPVGGDGLFLLGAYVLYQVPAGTNRDDTIYFRKTTGGSATHVVAADNASDAITSIWKRGHTLLTLMPLVAGDTIQLWTFNSNTETIQIVEESGTKSAVPYMWAQYMGATT